VETFERYQNQDAFVLGSQRVTYSDAARQISQIQQLLADLGIKYHGQVAVLSKNVPEVWLIQAATYLLGARYSGLHPMGAVEDYVWICNDAEVEVMIVHPSYSEAGRQILEQCPTVRHLLVIGESEVGDNLLKRMQEYHPARLDPGPAKATDTAWLQYTGGTTGRPKGVMVSHRAMLETTKVSLAWWQMPATPRYLAVAPITHAGTNGLFATLSRGGTVVLLQEFDPETFLRTIEKERISFTVLVPTMIYGLLDRGDPGKYDLSSLETVMYGAAITFPSRIEHALRVFGNVFVQTFGQTECVSTISALLKEEHDPVNRPGLLTSCGRPLPGTQLEVHDDEDRPVPRGVSGEICVRSPGVMTGYWKNPELTAETLRGGWHHTGDIGMLDDEGYLHIVDRKKDMVITGGFNVYPREVEDVIARDPAVAAVAVVGLPDEKWGEALTAYIVPQEGATIDPDEVRARVREAKGRHQVPKHVVFLDRMPVTSVGKFDKKRLRAMGLPR
jgi:fatty-acyl-CoA synthase